MVAELQGSVSVIRMRRAVRMEVEPSLGEERGSLCERIPFSVKMIFDLKSSA